MARYFREGFPVGQTIPEWEAQEGLPLFSVWPEAAQARSFTDPGWFLYTNASPEERKVMGYRRNRYTRDEARATA